MSEKENKDPDIEYLKSKYCIDDRSRDVADVFYNMGVADATLNLIDRLKKEIEGE